MIKVKVRNKGFTFTIPIPYALVHLGRKIITSNFSQRKVREWLHKRSQEEAEAARWNEYNNGLVSHTNQTNQTLLWPDILLRIMEQHDIKAMVEYFLEELDEYRGLVIVDVQSHDGTEVWIRL